MVVKLQKKRKGEDMLTKLVMKDGKLTEETSKDRYEAYMDKKVSNSPLSFFVAPEPTIFSTKVKDEDYEA